MKILLPFLLALGLPASLATAAEHEHSGHGAAPDTGTGAAAGAPAETAPPPGAASGLRDPGSTPTHDHMQASRFSWFKMDRLEVVDTGEESAQAWAGGIGWGGHFDRLWLTSEGERAEGRSEMLETQLYWSHAVARWWDATLGLRNDNGAGDTRRWAAFGIKGLAPYWFETAATAFVGESGQTALRLEGEYELLITNRLILQPDIELNFYGKEEAARRQGDGLAESEAGLRLRYEIRREFAPYLGVEWRRLHGQSADLAQAAGLRVHDTAWMAGVRLWF
jgi:copper resistance protein B